MSEKPRSRIKPTPENLLKTNQEMVRLQLAAAQTAAKEKKKRKAGRKSKFELKHQDRLEGANQKQQKRDKSLFDLVKLKNTLRALTNVRANKDFLTFVRREAPKIVTDFKMGRHIEVICHELQKCVDVGNQRLMIFLPPRSSKSVICSRLFPAWYMGRFPHHEILSLSNNDELATDFGRSVRDIVNSGDYSDMFSGIRLRQDVQAAGKWKTNKNGTYIAAGVRSKIAGRGAHLALLDDVMSEQDALSDSGRKWIKGWYPAGVRTRLMPNGSIVIINTRYHYDDICGWLLKLQKTNPDTEKWRVISIPAWLDEPSAKLLGLPIGSSYFPEWKPREVLARDEAEIKASEGSRHWNALYMQNPTPDEGGIIKKKWFKRWEAEDPPYCEFIIQTYDTAFSTKETADNSVIQTWGIFSTVDTDDTGRESSEENLILLSNTHGKFDYTDLRNMAQEQIKKYNPDLCIVEKKASGQSLIQDLRRARVPLLEYNPDRDKTARLYAASPYVEAGKVWLPLGKDWAEDVFSEIITFPNAAHDDMVDCFTMAVLYMRDSWRLTHPKDSEEEEESDVYTPQRKAYWRF